MEKFMELDLLHGTMVKYMKDSFLMANFMEMELCIIQMDKWSKEFGIVDRIYKCRKLMLVKASLKVYD
jgi:hypothetical protein